MITSLIIYVVGFIVVWFMIGIINYKSTYNNNDNLPVGLAFLSWVGVFLFALVFITTFIEDLIKVMRTKKCLKYFMQPKYVIELIHKKLKNEKTRTRRLWIF